MQRLHTRHTYMSCLVQSCPFYWSLRFIRLRPVSWCQCACLSAWWGFSVNYLGKPDRKCVYVFLNCVCLCQAVWTLPPVCVWQVMKPDWGNKQEVCGWRLVVLLEADSSCCHSGMFIPMMGLNPWHTHTWLHVHMQICTESLLSSTSSPTLSRRDRTHLDMILTSHLSVLPHAAAKSVWRF